MTNFEEQWPSYAAWLGIGILIGVGAQSCRQTNIAASESAPPVMRTVARNSYSDGLNRCRTLFTDGVLVVEKTYCTLAVGDSVRMPR